MYRHDEYENLNAEKEIDMLTEEIRQLFISNNYKTSLLKYIKGKTKTIT